MKTYITKAGDTFDLIAFQQLGDGAYTEKLIDANRDKIGTFVFGAGEKIVIPDIVKSATAKLPPWRR